MYIYIYISYAYIETMITLNHAGGRAFSQVDKKYAFARLPPESQSDLNPGGDALMTI